MSPEPVAAFARLVAGARAGVVFTGAGISTESGIPDFRSPGGLWTQNRPIDFEEFVSSEDARREAWRRRFAMAKVLDGARPNDGHRAVAELVRRGHVTTVITQNIDGLHQASGVPEDRVIEIHGSTMYAKCLDCEARYELDRLRAAFEREETPPRCDACGGHVKTATISFGQPMPAVAMRLAQTAAVSCDVFVAIGSSLVVYPAAGLPVLAKRRGAPLVLLNREPTSVDGEADLVIHAEIGPTLGALVSALP